MGYGKQRTTKGALPPIPAKKRKAISCPLFWAKPHPMFQTAEKSEHLCENLIIKLTQVKEISQL